MTLNKRGMKKRGNKMADETVYINKCSIKEDTTETTETTETTATDDDLPF